MVGKPRHKQCKKCRVSKPHTEFKGGGLVCVTCVGRGNLMPSGAVSKPCKDHGEGPMDQAPGSGTGYGSGPGYGSSSGPGTF